VIRVRDSGVGIAPELLDRVFDLFVQGSSGQRETPGGLGIGLSLARRLVEMHGGTIEAASAGPGHGSEFSVSLPVITPALRGEASPDGSSGTRMPRRRVLVADDNVDAAETTALLLNEIGCDVRSVHGGDAAVREAEAFRPELVLLDLGMPGVDGYAACRSIRLAPWGAGMVLVALSGWGQADDRQRSADAGFDLHLVKPVDPDVLMQVIRDVPTQAPQAGACDTREA
jgi:CheY-like chemotaxis protein